MVWVDGKINFSENFGWQVEDVQVFDKPIEAKGHLRLWEYDIDGERE